MKSRKGKEGKKREDDDDDKDGDNKGKQHNAIIITISLLTSIPGVRLPSTS